MITSLGTLPYINVGVATLDQCRCGHPTSMWGVASVSSWGLPHHENNTELVFAVLL